MSYVSADCPAYSPAIGESGSPCVTCQGGIGPCPADEVGRFYDDYMEWHDQTHECEACGGVEVILHGLDCYLRGECVGCGGVQVQEPCLACGGSR